MSIYRKEYTLLSSDVDAQRRLRLSTLFTMLQEASIAHTTELGMGREKTLDQGLLWIVTLQQASIRRLPLYDETVTLTCWPGKTMHLYFPRFYRLHSGDETLVEASALWALIDSKTRKIIFPEEHGISIEGEMSGTDPAFPKAPKLPELTEESAFTVPYSYTDLNGHMNNTRYFDLAEDTMPASLRCRNIRKISAEHSSEAHAGEPVTLRFACDQNAFFLSGEAEKRLFRLSLLYE